MRFFYFLARKVSYTFAINFYISFVGVIIYIFGLYMGFSFILYPFDKIQGFLLKWMPVAVLIPLFLHYIQVGMLTPLKVPALMSSLRKINNAFSSNLNLSVSELEDVYGCLIDLPLINTLLTHRAIPKSG